MHTNPEVLALLALGEDSATPDERAHVETCPVCTREVAELAHLTGVGRAVEDATPLESPSPEVWRRIQAELGFSVTGREIVAPIEAVDVAPPSPGLDSAGPPTGPESATDPVDETAPGTTRRRRVLALALAAALALIVGIGIGLGWNRVTDPSPTVIGEAQLAAAAPDWTGASGEATLERDSDGQRILVVRVATPRQVPGIRVVWIMDSTFKKMQPVGQLTGSEGQFRLDSSTNLADFPVIDVSQEPTNDTNPTHSGVSIVRGTLNI